MVRVALEEKKNGFYSHFPSPSQLHAEHCGEAKKKSIVINIF